MTRADLAAIAPELLLAGAGCLVLLLEAFTPGLRRAFTALSVLAAAGAGWLAWELPLGASFGGLLVADRLTAVGSLIVLASAALALLASQGYLVRERILGGEYHALLLWGACGMLLMLRATELLTVFVALELLSLCLYALAAFDRKIVVGTEAAIKYFLMGAFASAFVLYGIALVYGATGSTSFDRVADAFAGGGAAPWLGTIGVLLLVGGFGFKMSVAPFHAWAPDTYQGAPSPFVAFLSVAPKAAAAFVLIRVLATVFPDALGARWPAVVAALAVLSMVVGNLLALVQKDFKRMLAYSGVGHMGYLLIPLAGLDLGLPGGQFLTAAGGLSLAAAGANSWTPVLVYLAAYALMNAGAFAIVGMLYERPGEQHLISDLSGWGYRFPLLGLALTICMLSLGGIPPTVGFIGKYLVFLHAIQHGQTWLALVGVATSLVGVFYYLRVVYVLYMKDEVKAPAAGLVIDGWGKAAVVIAALGTLALGIFPALLLNLL
ncbi:MAG TPA: NADH-quinone oxidoreductase subunit N [Thermoanaerobaculia bacterium]|nr:NADH-quinone oxidoreductase subunit N [Thermoanaerobaculia bacterium]